MKIIGSVENMILPSSYEVKFQDMQNQRIPVLQLNFQTSSWSCLFNLSFKENKRKIRGISLFVYFSFSDPLGLFFFFSSRNCLFSESSAILLTALFSKAHLQIFTEGKVYNKPHTRKNAHQQVPAC